MIILGERYKFTKKERLFLKKNFKNINYILYKNFSTEENINQINNLLLLNDYKYIILNTKAAIEPNLLKYLKSIESDKIEYISIEEFMEEYLHKIIITETSFDIKLLENIYDYTILEKIAKRTIDYIAVILLFIPALFAIIYSFYRVHKESPGSIFFQQERVGQNEKKFNCIKLRSMHVDSEIDGPKFALNNDPRTFPWGETIRSTKIDELLQLWNVLKGEMHLIGPRPERAIWTQEFKKSIPYYNQRHTVLPGITGLAQIKYHYGRGKIDAKAKLEYDLYYIKNWNLKLELSIIWETILFISKKLKQNFLNF